MASRLIIKEKSNSKNICRNPTHMPYTYDNPVFQDWMCITYFLLECTQN